jgi:hypothetical protein
VLTAIAIALFLLFLYPYRALETVSETLQRSLDRVTKLLEKQVETLESLNRNLDGIMTATTHTNRAVLRPLPRGISIVDPLVDAL